MSYTSPAKLVATPKSKAKAPATRPPLAPTDPGYTRLHISPLDADLISTVIPASVLPEAQNISYHTIETFPERRYGFVDLPTEAAEKLKKKFNGVLLKGMKMKIDKAHALPEVFMPDCDNKEALVKKRKKIVVDFDGTEVGTSSKKRKQDKGVIKGIVLGDERKVKRGWTVSPEEARVAALKKSKTNKNDKEKDKKKKKEDYKIRSKYTDKPEALIKTVMPPGKPIPGDKADAKKKSRKDRKQSREIISHEFEHVTKFPTFLRNAPSKSVAKKFAPVEESLSSEEDSSSSDDEEEKSLKKVAAPTKTKSKQEEKKPEVKDDTSSEEEDTWSEEEVDLSDPSSSDSSDSDSDSSGESEKEESLTRTPLKQKAPEDAEISETPNIILTRPDIDPVKLDDRPNTSSSMKSLTIKIPPPATPAKVHPLKAIYKKAADADPVDEKPFTFFGGAVDEESDEEAAAAVNTLSVPGTAQVPMTPYTRQDFEARGMRSAAPTPDTAYPSRRKFFPGDEEDEERDRLESPIAQRGAALTSVVEEDEEGEEEGGARPMSRGGEGQDGENSEFQKWFWENRGELNRGWMRRRKTMSKERRMKDNKTRGFKRG